MHIPGTGEQVEMRLAVDASGLPYLEVLSAPGSVTYSLPGVLSLGWLRTADATYADCHHVGPSVGSSRPM